MSKIFMYLSSILLFGIITNLFALVDIYDTLIIDDNIVINDDVHLHSGAEVYNNNTFTLSINGNLVNEGTIRNSSESDTLSVHCTGNLTNSGILSNRYFKLAGNLTNSGTITNDSLTLIGTNQQTLYTSSALTPISAKRFTTKYPNNIIAGSNLYFNKCAINLNGTCSLDLSSGYDFNFHEGILQNANVVGGNGSELIFSLIWFIENSNFSDMIISGNISIKGDVKFTGTTVNNGNIEDYDIFANLSIEDNFTNNSVINDKWEYTYLYVNVSGNITNNGIWNNQATKFMGTNDQKISLINGSSISSPVIIFEEKSESTLFQWYFNKEILNSDDFSTENSNFLRWEVPIDSLHYGTFYCMTDSGSGRKIFINNGTFDIPIMTGITNDGNCINLEWAAIASATSYKIYSSDNPYSEEINWNLEGEVFTNSWSSLNTTENNKFYFVKAVY